MAKVKKRKSRSIKTKSSSGIKPLKTKMTKRSLIQHLASAVEEDNNPTSETKRIVGKTLEALAATMARSIMPGGTEVFMLPKLMKITLKTKKAIKPGTLVRSPATGEMVPSKGRPESKSVKIRPLALLKKAATGDM